jgi:hypothetical protein
MESAPIPKMSADDLRLDLEELRRLEGLAARPRVLSLLANEIRTVDAKVAFFSLFLTPRPRPFGRLLPFPSAARWADCGLCSVVMFLWLLLTVGLADRAAEGPCRCELRHTGIVQLGPG